MRGCLINMVATAFEQGATLLNYARGHRADQGRRRLREWRGRARDVETRQELSTHGQGGDQRDRRVHRCPAPHGRAGAEPMIAPSQGVHLVFDRSFLPGDSAIMVPHTSDGRVMFAIPWHGHTLVGTTDTPSPTASLEPVAPWNRKSSSYSATACAVSREETDARDDVLSVFAGIRPLVKTAERRKHGGAFARPHHPHR